MTVEGLDRLNRRIVTFKRELAGSPAAKRIERQAKALVKVADTQASFVIGGDRAFSGWRRGKPIVADVEGILENQTTGVVRPKGRVRGQWRVMESGRKAYRAGDRRVGGVRHRKKTNDYVTKYRKVKRNVGAMRGWKAWSKAERRMILKARVGHTKDTVRAFRRTFGRR